MRLLGIALVSQYILDWYHHSAKVDEYWQPSRYHSHGGIDYDIHNPYTDAFNEMMVHNWVGKTGYAGLAPDGKTPMKVL